MKKALALLLVFAVFLIPYMWGVAPAGADISTGSQVKIAAGGARSLAIKSDGTVWAWGGTPVPVQNLTGVVAVEAGSFYSLALKSDGTVWAWGDNYYGQLGDGTTTNRYTPVQVQNLTGVVAIAAGGGHSLALKSDGTVWAWGYNGYGQLGDGTITNRTTPVQVKNLTGVVAVAAGGGHSLALKSDGTVWAWGYNGYGQLGDGTTMNRYTPVQVQNLTGVVAIAAGSSHSLALKSDGTVWAWGNNGYGQLGDGTTTNRTTPVRVQGLTDVVAIAAGNEHSLALKSDGTVWTWGWNYSGQLGDGTTTNRYTPVQVQNLTGVVAIAAGGGHSLALKSDGTVWAWGNNDWGELGDGTRTDRHTPVQVSGLNLGQQTTPDTLLVSPASLSIIAGQTQQLSVVMRYSDGSTQDVTNQADYSIDNSTVATVSAAGLVTAVAPGTATITVTCQDKTATVPVTVTNPVVVESISVDPAALSMVAGQAQQLTVTAHKSDGTTENVTNSAIYQSSNGSVAAVTGSGEVTAVSPGTATITVNYQGKTASVSVEVVELSSVLPQGDIIVLKVPQLLQPVTYNCATGFTVTENGVNVPVEKVEVKDGSDGWPYSEVWLYLERPVTMGSDVVVQYNADPNCPITPASGGTVTIPASTAAVNYSAAPFTIERSTVYVPSSGDVIYVDLPTRVNAVDYQGSAGFTIHTGSVTVPVTRVVAEGTQLRIYPAYNIPSGEPVSITYTPVSGYEITTVGGAPLVVTTNPVVVTNQSTAPLVYYDPVVSSDGTTVTVTVPADLGSVTYEGNAGFRVYANGQEIPVVKVELDGNKIILYLGVPLVAGQPVDVSYSPVGGQPISTPNNTLPEQSAAGDNRSEVTLVGLEVEPAAVNVEEGTSQQLHVTARYSSGVAVDVTGLAAYESDNTSVARVSGDGLVTGVGAGTANITVTYGEQSVVVPVTVVNPAPVLESISVVPARVDLAVGATWQLAVTAHYSDGSTRDVTSQAGYSSGDVSVAMVNSSGLVTGKAQGSTTITVSYEGKTATVPVTVAAPAVESITVVPNPVSIVAGRSQQLVVTVRYSDGTVQDVTGSAVYQSGGTSVARVEAGGVVTGVSQGSTTITVGYGGKTATVPVTVTAPVVESLTVQPGTVTLAVGDSRQLAVTARFSDGTTRDVTDGSSYQVGNSTIAVVSGSGLVTGLAPGNTSITVGYAGQTVTVPVTVNAPPADLTGVSVQPNPLVLYKGSSQRLKVTEQYSDGSSVDVTSYAGFQSSDPSVAKVDSFGLVTGVKEGTTAILVTYKGEVYLVSVTVEPVEVTRPGRPGDGGSSPPVTRPSRPGDGSSPPPVSNPSRPGDGSNPPPVSGPDRPGGANPPVVSNPGGRGSSGSPGVAPPALPRGTGDGAVVVPSDRPQPGGVPVTGRTR
ncbi:Ig domain protein group 2 domain protein [Desulfofundulus kuznetsovii DSM 6115]|uniref:Ig domain protein group 2 domain protein n=1 Tax=Desulfofundulus kuznetsovii (strain DSM 6115 / VKM B-1805 / 17) TaxID=760568 RepID=A0AAU8PFB7_DESK7|nr:Ig domain protein group 2 domain protein [Desulfofundulus kuznetsovii DSM 6115]